LPDVPTKLTARKTSTPNTPPKKNVEDTAQREADNARKELAKVLGSAANDLRDNSMTTVKLDGFAGPGTGIPYANFLAGVKTIYTRAWIVPDGVEDDEATTEVSVTIARDGTVLRRSIVRRSGNSVVDNSVQRTLDRVSRAVPLPPESKEDERTVTIGFNVKAKRGAG
jgi:TonB family protein